MFAVIGLGNPGVRYSKTRHNAGFLVVEEVARRFAAEDRWVKHGNSEVIKTRIGSEVVVLIKPLGFMNRSGDAAQGVLSFYKVSRDNIVVVHDDLDIKPGDLKVRLGGSAAGHKGVQDIAKVVGGLDFYRVRVGIGHPRDVQVDEGKAAIAVADWVLDVPGLQERKLFESAIQRASEAVEVLITQGVEIAQNRYNRGSEREQQSL